jgi:type III restriction enzyme
MAMIVAWQTINAVCQPGSTRFTRGFLVVTPGLTIRDRLQVLQPNDPYSYYGDRELVPNDMLGELDKAKIVITNYHAFKPRGCGTSEFPRRGCYRQPARAAA